MRRKELLLLVVAAVTAANAGCFGRCRNLLYRGAPCGTATAAPAMIGSPLPAGTPMAAPLQAPGMQQVVVPQQGYPGYPCCPPCQPCPTTCSPCDTQGVWFGGYVSGDCDTCNSGTTYDPGYEYDPGYDSPVTDQTGSGGLQRDPGPAQGN